VACARHVRLRVLEILAKGGADVNAVNARGATPLHVLCMRPSAESPAAAALLLNRGANLGARDEQLETPLHKAVACGQLVLAVELVRAGAHHTLNVCNTEGLTALDVVAMHHGDDQRRMLLEAISTPPLWVPDELSTACMLCRQAYAVKRRRHHCRHCGVACCHACSPHKSGIAKFGQTKPVRCCRHCFPLVVQSAVSAAAAEDDGEDSPEEEIVPPASETTSVAVSSRTSTWAEHAASLWRDAVSPSNHRLSAAVAQPEDEGDELDDDDDVHADVERSTLRDDAHAAFAGLH
jgi:hypothetical protein